MANHIFFSLIDKKIFISLRNVCFICILAFGLITTIATCGGGVDNGNGSGSGNNTPSPTGSITFRIQGDFDCTTDDISTIEANVYDEGEAFSGNISWAGCTADPLTITGVEEGNNIVLAIIAKDSHGNKVCRGEATGITVIENQTTDVGTVVLLDLFISSLLIDSDDGNVFDSSIAIDSTDKVHISYCEYEYDSNTGTYDFTLKYAWYASGTSEIYTIDTIDKLASQELSSTSIAVDSNDKVHIAYSLESIKYATNISGSWETFDITDEWTGGSYVSIAVDSTGKVHFSYDVGSFLNYSTYISGTTEIYTIDKIGGGYSSSSIALDSKNNAHISYWVGYNDVNDEDLKYATNASGKWEKFMIDWDDSGMLGEYPSIAIDSNDKVHISYYHRNKNDLKYATNVSGSWQNYIIDSQDYMARIKSSIAIDSNDSVHISYCGFSRLKYASNVLGPWGITTVTLPPWEGGNEGAGGNGVFGLENAIAIDLNDKVHFSFDFNNDYDLYYAYAK